MKKKESISPTSLSPGSLKALTTYKEMMIDTLPTYASKSFYPGPYPTGPSTVTVPVIPYSPPPPPPYGGVSGVGTSPKPEPVRATDLEEKLERIAVALEKIVDRFC